MEPPTPTPRKLAFGRFEIDLDRGELRKGGFQLRIQDKPFRVLALLLEHPGELVSRDDLQRALWPDQQFGDFDHGLHQAMSRLRDVLGDPAAGARFIETVPGKGYRFVAPVTDLGAGPIGAPGDPGLSAAAAAEAVRPPRGRRQRLPAVAAGILAAGLGLGILWHLQRSAPPPTEAPPRPVLIVLPFRDLGPDPEPFLSPSLTTEVIARLGRLAPGRLAVIAPSTAESYGEGEASVAQLAAELQVDYVLEGAITQAEDRVRIRFLLVRAQDQTVLSSEQVELAAADLFGLQEEVAQRVASSLAQEILDLPRIGTDADRAVPEAYRAFLRGRHFWDQRTPRSLRRAVESFAEAIEIDPGFARAHAGLALAYALYPSYGIATPLESLPRAKEAAQRALRLDPRLSEAHTALGWVRWTYLGDPKGAVESFRRAIQLNANDATAWQWQAGPLVAMGQFDEALKAMDEALERDPLSLIVLTGRGWVSFYSRRYEETIRYCREALELQPGFAYAWQLIAQAQTQQGKYRKALASIDRSLALDDAPAIRLDRIYLLAEAGDPAAARASLARLLEETGDGYLPPYRLAFVYESLGRRQEALRWLRAASREMAFDLALAAVDPRLDRLREDPGFQALLVKKPGPTGP